MGTYEGRNDDDDRGTPDEKGIPDDDNNDSVSCCGC